MKTIGIVLGSLRKNSFSGALAHYISKNAPEGYQFKLINISDLPVYNQDYDEASPESYTRFRAEVKAVDAFLFITPEHNRSYPAAIKNALDVGSRPYGESVWNGKPGAVLSQSPGAIGGFGANHHLRQVLSFLNVYTLLQPEAYVGNIMASLNEQGEVANDSLEAFLNTFTNAFVEWIEKF